MLTACCGMGTSDHGRRSLRRIAAPGSLCPTCFALTIANILRNGLAKENMVPLGSLADILCRADQCRFCNLLGSLFRRRWLLDTHSKVDLSGVVCSLYATNVGALADPHLVERKQCHRLRIDFSHRPTMITNAVTRARMDLTLDIQLLEEDARKFRRGKEVHGRRMTDTIDLKLVKNWISLCEREHGDACKSVWWKSHEVQLPPFARMVDVTLMSVVRRPSDCRYVALSYVWGTAGGSYWTTKSNLDSRAQPAGLDLSLLPATIVDAIHVTQALGERYLWVDALCIIQDCSDDKSSQISVMELIYSGALFTIIAAGGDGAYARLPGLSKGSRSPQQRIEVIQDLHLAIPLPSLREAIAQTFWDTRGWTYQELLLSRRRLFFTKDQVYFECAKDVWCEDLVAESKTLPFSDHPMRVSGSGGHLLSKKPVYQDFDSTRTYGRIVERYTQRHLTYASDVINAITAVTNAMARGFRLSGRNTESFRYGIYIWNLNHSLLWQPRLDSEHTRRENPDAGVPAWPSWAWAGWAGAVYYNDLNQLLSTAIWETFQEKPEESFVRNWYIVDDNRQLIRLDVENISFIKIEGLDAQSVPPPRYCIPEGDIDPQRLVPFPCTGTLIFLTQRATFRVSKLEGTSNQSASKAFPHTIFHILSDVRQPSVPAGRMILPCSTPSSTALEFIVLSRCAEMRGLYNESVYGDPYDACLFHVMAVRRAVHDVRVWERVGLGVIFEQAWLECRPNVETVLLG